MASIFPFDDLDKPTTAGRLLGSWLGQDYHGNDETRAIVEGLFETFRGTDLLRDFLIKLSDRQTVPLAIPLGPTPVRLQESQANASAAIPRYAEGFRYGEGLQYGRPVRHAGWYFPLLAQLTEIGLLVDAPETPTRCWFPGIDFTLEADRILFRENPFDDASLVTEVIWSEGRPTDREIRLWAVGASDDQLDVQTRYGFVTGFLGPSTAAYRRFVNSVWDAWTRGTSLDAVQRVVSALADSPVASEPQTVLELAVEGEYRLVVTDREVHRVPMTAGLLVSIGDSLYAGQPITDAATVIRVTGARSVAGLRGLSLDSGWLAPGFYDAISFENQSVPTSIGTRDGRLTVEFPLGGWPGDVERFWELMHERGIAAGQTLADLLDPRAEPDGPPFPSAMPATMNPLTFLADNVLRNKALVVRLRPSGFGPRALPPHFVQSLRAVVPPWAGVLVILELEFEGDEITMDAAGSSSRPGVSEGPLSTLDVARPQDTLNHTLIVESPRLRDLDGVCV